jgi:hypothetical protein
MDQIESLVRRPKAYNNIDGVGELGVGFMTLGFALVGWMQLHTPSASVWHRMYTLFIFVGLVAAIVHYGSKAIKTHITYPRTGFVEYPVSETRWRPMAIGAIVSGLLAVVLSFALRFHWNLTTPFALVGLLLAASYARGFARSVPWKWAVVGILALGSVIIAMLPRELIEALARDPSEAGVSRVEAAMGAYWLSFTMYGVTLMISGGISFWLYLRHTQAPAQDAQ